MNDQIAAKIDELTEEVLLLRSAIRNHRAQKGFSGKIDNNDHRLWEAAGLQDAPWAEIPGDM